MTTVSNPSSLTHLTHPGHGKLLIYTFSRHVTTPQHETAHIGSSKLNSEPQDKHFQHNYHYHMGSSAIVLVLIRIVYVTHVERVCKYVLWLTVKLSI